MASAMSKLTTANVTILLIMAPINNNNNNHHIPPLLESLLCGSGTARLAPITLSFIYGITQK